MIKDNGWKANPYFPDYDKTRDNIIICAAEVIEEKGLEKLRFDAVAKRAGCARQTLYRYFNSKEELIRSVVVYFTMLNAEDIREHVKRIKDPRKRLVEVIHRGAINLSTNPKFKIFVDVHDSQRYVTECLNSVPELIDEAIEQYLAETRAPTSPVKNKDIVSWLVMQIYALSLFDRVGENPRREKAFIDQLVVGSLFE